MPQPAIGQPYRNRREAPDSWGYCGMRLGITLGYGGGMRSASVSRPVIALKGVRGAYLNLASRDRYPESEALACVAF